MRLPNDREQARAARQAALDKLQVEVERIPEVTATRDALVGIYERNHLAEMVEASMRRETT